IELALGEVFYYDGQYEVALDKLMNTLLFWEQYGYLEREVMCHYFLGAAYLKLQNEEQALNSLNKAYQHKAKLKEVQQAIVHYFLAKAYEKTNIDSAYYHLSTYDSLYEIYYESEALRKISESDVKFQNEQQAKEIAQNALQLNIARQDRMKIIYSAVIAGFLLVLVSMVLFFRQRMKKAAVEHRLQQEQMEKQRLSTLNEMKSAFLTNISHEFRTPLTLIQGPLAALSENHARPMRQRYLELIQRNTDRLQTLIDQLLDLAGLEVGAVKLLHSKGNLRQALMGFCHSFDSMAERKGIVYRVTIDENLSGGIFDSDALEKILTNLLSNAFKFTDEAGSVTCKVTSTGKQLQLEVSDTGMGIAEEALSRVFDRFYQDKSSESQHVEGSGIGLSLTKELVILWGGTISVSSELGVGTCFTVMLPVEFTPLPASDAATEPDTNFTQAIQSIIAQHTVLIIEDNAEMSTYIGDQLSDSYCILQAVDGQQGLNLAFEAIPDLIISDLMMPKVNGLSVCEQLKADERTSHIPVILLTAKATQADRVIGLDAGADDYQSKPFDREELKLKIRNLINLQQRIQVRIKSQSLIQLEADPDLTSVDKTFLKKVNELIIEQLGDDGFGVNQLSEMMGLSRSQLHRKLKAISGFSANELIRNIRLEKAMEQLSNQMGSISEVAYQTGFSSPAYFATCFREKYGYAPSELLKSSKSTQ
ncbi:MAG: ATP-binding protein, partial [Bacteroidota bacterium]